MNVDWIAVADSNPTDRKHRVVLFDDEGVRWCDWKVYDVKRSRWLNCEIQPRYWLEGLSLPKKDEHEF